MNHTRASACDICPVRHYCVDSCVTPTLCPEGNFCPSGTGFVNESCPIGTYGPVTGLADSSECTECDPGMFCSDTGRTVVSGPCSPGYYCLIGVNTPAPDNNNTGIGGPCPEGTYCPGATPEPIGCPNGTFNDLVRQAECQACQAGYYCIANSTTYINTPCWKGYYCPQGTGYPTQYACPAGTFNNKTLADDIFDCLPCPAGEYCEGDGLPEPSGDCAPGWYCSGGSYSSKPTPYVNDTNEYSATECPIYSRNETGGICTPGTYCPEGSDRPVPCSLGQFCGNYALSTPSGDCLAGFFCNGSAEVHDPVACITGHYCPKGTVVQEPCPPGTFSGTEQNVNITDCLPCTGGSYCEGYGLSSPTNLCAPGYFCPEGQDTYEPTDLACSPGHFCELGSWNQTGCPSGWYQPDWGRHDCDPCPAGSYCKAFGDYELLDAENITESGNFSGRYRSYRGVSVPTICPAGSYCPEKTQFGTEFLCPEGTYSNKTELHNETQCTPCEPGMYCPGEGNTQPFDECSAGFYCTQGASSATPTDGTTGDECPEGLYCLTGSIVGQGCPKGTFSNQLGLMDASECWNCTAGYYCASTGLTVETGTCWAGFYCSGSSEEPAPVAQSYGDVCWAGYYCPNGTDIPDPCPPGTFSDVPGLPDRESCTDCSPGYYCETGGKTNVTGKCDEGFYCVKASNNSAPLDGITGDICWAGHYCEEGSSIPIACPNGTFMNHTGASECDICPEGRYCIYGDQALPCPQGYYCPEGTGYDYQMCPSGMFGSRTGLVAEEFCTPCTGGYYCETPGSPEPDGNCSAGYYCDSGVDMSTPTHNDGHKGTGGVCPVGSYCPKGTVIPFECEAGTYTDSEGQSSCNSCLAGFYCPTNTSDPLDFPCPVGSYCPTGTTYPYEYPCPEGSYNGLEEQQNISSCDLCPPGMYCQGEGLERPTGNCSAGWFCTGGAWDSMPSPPGNATIISDCTCPAVNYTGNICPPGTYCPSGSPAPIDCDYGQYCDNYGLPAPTDDCIAGFYCPRGQNRPDPPGFTCPVGYYCLQGSGWPSACPNGTFSNTTQNTEELNCEACTPGKYCAGEHLSKPSSDCMEGYYCPGGQSERAPSEYICPKGFACPEGSSTPQLCPRGTFQSEEEQAECDICPLGKYCDPYELGNVTGVIVPVDCIPGHFCPNGTEYAEQNKCPVGTYSNKTNLDNAGKCTSCDAGWYCDEEGLTEPKAKCQAGFYCTLRAEEPAPTDGVTGDICPQGKYCEEGSITGEDCPIGRYGNQTGLRTATDCPLCDPGWYCNSPGLEEPFRFCSAGHYCKLGATSPNPTNETFGYLCPVGHYCLEGTPVPATCDAGTYNPLEGQDEADDCESCDGGFYCKFEGQANVTAQCYAGYYCSEGASEPNPEDDVTGNICPIGHYCPIGSDRPLPCNNATYMNDTGASECLVCPEGYMCIHGDEPDPCPAGFFCPVGTGYDTQPCPEGTFGASTLLSESMDCTRCTGGHYCQSPGMVSFTGQCDAGHYCTEGVNIRAPNGANNTGTGGICSAGHECPIGTAVEIPCIPGSYTPMEQMEACLPCPAGKYCENATVTPLDCPVGHYCPESTGYADQYPCPAGSYNNLTGQPNSTNCEYCPPGMYCEGAGLSAPSGWCDEGFYCSGGSNSKRPFDVGVSVAIPTPGYAYDNDTCHPLYNCVCPDFAMSTGGLCGPGFYCPYGSPQPLNCPGGMYCETPGLSSPTGNCTAGWYCNHTSSEPDQYICPSGYYCPDGTAVPIGCPSGTYSGSEGNNELADCLNCTAGKYCEGDGNSAPDADCAPGYYCPGGQDIGTPTDLQCPVGHYCPESSHEPIVCTNGTYQPLMTMSDCDLCPEAYYCDSNEVGPVSSPTVCPQGYYCPEGTELGETNPCPEGTYGDDTMYTEVDDCRTCTAGYYCGEDALTAPSGECYAGYYCTGEASSATPYDDMVDDTNNSSFTGNDVCPIGFFCPNGTSYPEPCPSGTFSQNTRVTREEDCEECPPGHYCNMQGFVKVSQAPLCDPGYVCTGGSTTPTPDTSSGMGYPCPVGHYCPAGTITELGCNIGTYQPSIGQDNCTECPAGFMCPYTNMSEPLPCKSGHYCPAGEPSPVACPEGTFNNATGASIEEECIDCTSGMYCEGIGNSYPTGPCIAGYYCYRGASNKVPADNPNYPDNGFCPPGYYCEEGTPTPKPCPIGTLRSVPQAEAVDDCYPCTGGYYCDTPGRTNFTDYCSAGFYCPANETVSNPTPPEFKCWVGHYCPEGSPVPLPCPVGKYQPNEGTDECISCQAGYYCQSALEPDPQPCPPYHYCPEATMFPISCPNGTYTYDNTTTLKEESECLPCAAGKFCRGGRISDSCSAGYFCLSGSYEFTPDNNSTNPDQDQCPVNTMCAGPCPAGYYCPEGIEDPIPCPNITLRDTDGASQRSECVECPAGSMCLQGDPMEYGCPLGHYCELGMAPQECPLYHYRDDEGAASEGDCYNCQPGYFCNETGMTNTTFTPCPVAHYCLEATEEPVPCTGGRMSTTEGRTSNEDCPLCTPGFYCPNDTINVHGIPCRPTYECPEGASIEVGCRGGHYCEGETGEPPICPEGYYCPLRSSAPTICEYPEYCPEGSEVPLTCPLGYKAVDHAGKRYMDTVSCNICPAGFYGNHSERLTCDICPEGYFCPAGTGDPTNNPCPVGYYCPAESGEAIACPTGKYGNIVKAYSADQCADCPVNTFNNMVGQKACRPCGSSSTAEEGKSVCTCMGKYRSFQTQDGSCVCQSGYLFYDEIDQPQTDENSGDDCQPIVDERCDLNQVRDASTRKCIDPATYDCTVSCPESDGTFNNVLGRCDCGTYTDPLEICNKACMNTKPSITGTLNSNGQLVLTTVSSDGSTTSELVANVIGPSVHTSGSKNTEMATFGITGVVGHIITDSNEVIQILIGEAETTTITYDTTPFYSNSTIARRRLLVAESASGVPGIANPIFCLELEEMLVFKLTIDDTNRSLSNYPVYIKDHLFNTNPMFDYSEFRDLKFYVENTNVSINAFAHVFTESGQYVFADAQEIQRELIVSVQEEGQTCPDGLSKVLPSDKIYLTELGIGKSDAENEEPDWGLIIGMLAFLFACVVMLVVAVIVWRPQNAGIYPMKMWKPRYRNLGAPQRLPNYLQYQDYDREAILLGPRIVEGSEGKAAGGNQSETLEDFNVRTLFDKLEDQSLYLSQQLSKHQDDMRSFYERMSQQTDGLKVMLNNFDVSVLEAGGKAKQKRRRRGSGSSSSSSSDDEGPTVVNAKINRQFHVQGSKSRETELMDALRILIDKLNSGQFNITPEMMNKASSKGTKVISGNLLSRQNAERLQLERELVEDEQKQMDTLLQEHEKERQEIITRMNARLTSELEGDLSQEEVEAVMSRHEKALSNALDRLDHKKEKQMYDLQQKLAQRRMAKEMALRKRHQQEAEEAGLPPLEVMRLSNAGQIKTHELTLGIGLSEASTALSKAQMQANEEQSNEELYKYSENMSTAIDSIVQTGGLDASAAQDLSKEQFDSERAIKQRMDKRRIDHTSILKSRMAQRRRNKIRKIKNKQEAEMDKLGDLTAEEVREIEVRNQKEIEALEAKLDAEENQQIMDINKQINEEQSKEIKKAHRDILQKASSTHNVDQVLTHQLMDQMRRDNESIHYELGVQRDRQESELKAKIQSRQQRRQKDFQRIAEEEAAQRFLTEQQKQVHQDDVNLTSGLQVNMNDLSIEEQAVVREHQRVQEEMTERHEEEKKTFKKKLEEEGKQKQEADLRRMDSERMKVITEKKNKQAAEITARTDLSDEEMQQLLTAHAREIEDLEDKLDGERSRQQLQLRDKLAKRRKQLELEQKRKHEVELAKELLEQKKELADVRSAVVKDKEKKEIIEGIQGSGGQNSEKIIKSVLDKRHHLELNDLDGQFEAERKVAVEGALSKLHDKYHSKRELMIHRHEKELADLAKEGLSPEELQQRRASLLNKQQLEMSQLEKELSAEKLQIEQGALSDWELRYARAKLEMKERHYQEYADALREFSGDQSVNQLVSAEQAQKAAEDLDDLKSKLERERLENEEKLLKEKEDFEKAEKKRMAKELSEFEKRLQEEEKKEKQRHEKNLTSLNKRKEQLVEEKKQKHLEKLEAMKKEGCSKEEQERLIEEYEHDVAKLKQKLDEDRMRMQSSLQERLKKKRDEKLKAKKENVQLQMKSNIEDHNEELKMEEERLKADEVLTLKESVNIDHLLSTAEEPEGVAMPNSYAMAAAMSDEDLTNLLMASPLYRKMEEIKSMMKNGGLLPKKDKTQFLDERDQEWVGDTELVPVDLNKLTGRTFVIYKFGVFISKLVATNCGHQPVTLLLAEKIPNNPNLTKNAYRNSYHFDDVNQILYMRLNRLDFVGDFVLVLVHALAHIKIGDMIDDTDQEFTREFYNALSTVCNDLFFARYRRTSALTQAEQELSAEQKEKEEKSSRMLLESLFGDSHANADSENVMEQLLDMQLMRGSDSSGVNLTQEQMNERLSKYNNTSVNIQMRNFLGSVEDKMTLAKQHGTNDKVDERLSQLTGKTVLTRRVAPQPGKDLIDQLPGELSGTAMWKKSISETIARQYAGGRIQLATDKAANKDLFYTFFQDEVKSLEEKIDNLSEQFSSLSKQVLERQEKVHGLGNELKQQKDLVQKSDGKTSAIKDTTEQLSMTQSSLTTLIAKRANTSHRLEMFRKELEDRQAQLQMYREKSARKETRK
ncbi:uncharacterized protein [Antedon mediterranea]|uniref:uncharacterized protein n=1 Tax=Antedon mediterranea TaxID=105859 RepID=UPI003AF4F74A